MKFSRHFAMPNADTFSVKPIGDFVRRYLGAVSGTTVDMFARNNHLCTFTNDLNPATTAEYHRDAEDFLLSLGLWQAGKVCLALFDPPYSPRQISECYKGIGREVTSKDTQNAALYRRVRDALHPLMAPNGIVLSFGWSSNGMGVRRGYVIEELMLVAHGGAHNDTICIAERCNNS